ncbi:MAG: methyltransferase domain-containing protein [Candidatus Neomarinimicrobiota bacterium]|nr:methyltransferase domain-containing protein [Candidatus Neomarinimicrobiota bacterium]
MPIDHVLKLYSETIRSDYLHYGFWGEPNSVEIESITLQEIKNAQDRYIEHLASFIPNEVNSILDVGCGIGGNAEYLINQGYVVETLSPDDFQKSTIVEKFNNEMTFHHCKFEKFQSEKQYDLILESESACYIRINKGFEKAQETLRAGGYLLASDYFVHFRDDSKNLHLRSSHDMEKYLSSAKAHGFELIREYDQTDNTMPTLDYGKYFIERFINPTIEYSVHSAKKNYPKTAALIGKLVAPKLEAKKNQLDLLDSSLFRKYRKYMIYLFQKQND